MKLLISNIILLLVFSASVSANTEPIFKADYDKVIEKEFPINADGTFEVKNKFGSVNISTWNKNAVSIKVIIEVKTKSESKANKLFDKVDIDFSNNPGYVKAETNLESDNWNWGKDEEFQINYEVNMPATAHLNLSNKYGNSYVPNLDNGADIWIAYGNLTIESIKGKTIAEIAYANMSFESLEHIDLDSKHSNISGETVGNLEVDSKYSQVKIATVGNVDSESKHDLYEIGTVGNFVNSGKYDAFNLGEVGNVDLENGYADMKIGLLHTDLTAELKYGSINIKSVDCEKGEIDLETEHVEVVLGMENCNNLSIDYSGKHTNLKVPSDMQGDVQRDGGESDLRANYGSGGKTIKADMKYGGLKIK